MKERFFSYFNDNWKWMVTYVVFILADTILTMLLLNKFGFNANPFVGDKNFDWSFHWWRADTVIILMPIIALTKWNFTRNWLLQGITVGYGWSVLNGLSDLLFGVDIGIYQFLPGWAYIFGIMFQFAVGLIILWVYRGMFGKEKVGR